jgi:chloramphenicol 3-O phosphotransferase
MTPPETRWPDLIFVNGPSSAGKTTLCRALQSAILEAYPCIGFDDFVFTSAPRYYLGADMLEQTSTDSYTAEGVEMVRTSAPGEPVSVTAAFGPVFRRLLLAMPHAVRALVDAGNGVIFDEVLHDAGMYRYRRRALAGLDVCTVGVVCDLRTLETRERSRGDRVLGRARGLIEVVHSFCDDDVIVDTGKTDPDGCVAEVLAAVRGRSRRAGLP